MITQSDDHVLAALMTAARDFSLDALAAIGPQLGARLVVGCQQYVAVECSRARARVLVEAPGGQVAVVYQAEGETFPAALGVAAARFATAAIARLSDRARRTLARLLAAGTVSLAVAVSRDDGSAQLLLDDGGPTPHPLVTVQAEPATVQ